ncbi:MAG: hypothetical protein AAGI23_11565 [Bacteroidota bacterium]
MNYFFLLLLLLCSSVVFGQQDYLAYYQQLNQGKLAALDGRMDSAVQYYHNTFERFEFVFARDVMHAIQLAAQAKDSIQLPYFLELALKKGISIDELRNINDLIDYKEASFWTPLEKKADSLHTIYNQSVNWEIREIINEFLTEDQKVRDRYYSTPFWKRRKIGKEWEALNRQQIEKMIDITHQYGFPGEKLIGWDDQQMHPKLNGKRLSAGAPIVIFIHHYSQPNPSVDSLLFDQVKLGNLYNEHFATICDFEAKFGKAKYPTLGYFGWKHTDDAILPAKYDERRRKIGLLSLCDQMRLDNAQILTSFWRHLY